MRILPQHTLTRGFTLIELLVVIAIIGTLASVVLASLNSARESARNAARAAEMQQVVNAMELYYSANGQYPNRAPSPHYLREVTGLENYLDPIPSDPRWGGQSSDYRYYTNNQDGGFVLLRRVEGISGEDWCRIQRGISGGWGGQPDCNEL